MKKKFITGSQSFFHNLEGFYPKDIDILIFNDSPEDYNKCYDYKGMFCGDKCIFEWNNKGLDFLINFNLNHPNPPMKIIAFLSPGVAEYLGLTIEKLKLLEPLVLKLDDKHQYAKIIYDSYIENNEFNLTEEQRQRAFEIYKESRSNI